MKALTVDRSKFRVGELIGNIKVQELSRGLTTPETDVKERPEQPKGSGMVSHLSPKEQYLVVRISKCENLPIADFDSGSSDPYLRVSWDGMVQFSIILKRTVRPVMERPDGKWPISVCSSRCRANTDCLKTLNAGLTLFSSPMPP